VTLRLIVSGKLIQMETTGEFVSGDQGTADAPLLSYTVGRLEAELAEVAGGQDRIDLITSDLQRWLEHLRRR
jgi:hypothetical protein